MPPSSIKPAACQPPSPAPATPGRLVVDHRLLLAVHESRRDSLCGLLAALAPACRQSVASSLVDAMLQLAQAPVDLLVLDLQLEPSQPLALIHLLARFAPAARILAFDDRPGGLPIQPYRVHAWPDAPSVLRNAIAAGPSHPALASAA